MEFITWEGLNFVVVYKLLTYNNELTDYEAPNHSVYFLLCFANFFKSKLHQLKRHHVMSKLTKLIASTMAKVWP